MCESVFDNYDMNMNTHLLGNIGNKIICQHYKFKFSLSLYVCVLVYVCVRVWHLYGVVGGACLEIGPLWV